MQLLLTLLATISFVWLVLFTLTPIVDGALDGRFHDQLVNAGAEGSYENRFRGPRAWLYDLAYEVARRGYGIEREVRRQERIERNIKRNSAKRSRTNITETIGETTWGQN